MSVCYEGGWFCTDRIKPRKDKNGQWTGCLFVLNTRYVLYLRLPLHFECLSHGSVPHLLPASCLHSNALACLQWFSFVDKDNNGSVSIYEMQNALSQGGLHFSLQTVASLMRCVPGLGMACFCMSDHGPSASIAPHT